MQHRACNFTILDILWVHVIWIGNLSVVFFLNIHTNVQRKLFLCLISHYLDGGKALNYKYTVKSLKISVMFLLKVCTMWH